MKNSFMVKRNSASAKQAEVYVACSFMPLAFTIDAVITASIFISVLILGNGIILIRRLNPQMLS